MKKIPCWLEFDDATNTVTIRHAKTNTLQMMIKLEAGAEGTMTRLEANYDCDNYWIGVKPADETVTKGLFRRNHLQVKEFKFDLV